MKRISIEQILMFYKKMILKTGGLEGLRDKSILDSSINNAFTRFDGIDMYKSIEEKCSNICYNIINNHPFVDGNKRMGVYIMLILLEYNGFKLKFEQYELIEFGLNVAKGELSQTNIIEWIAKHKI